VMLATCDELITTEAVSITDACTLTGRSRATHYRAISGPMHGPPAPRPTPSNALSVEERAEILSILHSPGYRDLAVAQVWAMVLDDGRYLCSRKYSVMP